MNITDWNAVERALSIQFGRCKLKIDGKILTLCCEAINRRLQIVWFVDGQFLGRWLSEDCIERQKFARPSIRKLYSKKELEKFKRCGIKGMDKKITLYYFSWPSFQSLKRHLQKTCTDIEISHE